MPTIASPPAAVVTGASSGIGAAAARRIAREPGARLLLVARRAERLRALAAELPAPAEIAAVDLTEPFAPLEVRERAEAALGRPNLLVNNAGASWRGTFARTGWANVRRNLEIDLDAPLRLTEALLPLLRAAAPSAIVNVGSVAGRVPRPDSGGYSVAKAALNAWSDALRAEEARHGVHVGLVLPGFVATEGFPHHGLRRRPHTRWLVSSPEKVADAIWDAGPGGRAERYVPRPYGALALLRAVAPPLVRRAIRA